MMNCATCHGTIEPNAKVKIVSRGVYRHEACQPATGVPWEESSVMQNEVVRDYGNGVVLRTDMPVQPRDDIDWQLSLHDLAKCQCPSCQDYRAMTTKPNGHHSWCDCPSVCDRPPF